MAIEIRLDGDRRSIQVKRQISATRDQAWAALAAGAGISFWFCPTQLEEGSTYVRQRGGSHTRMPGETKTRFGDHGACLGHHRRAGAFGQLVSSSACLGGDGRPD